MLKAITLGLLLLLEQFKLFLEDKRASMSGGTIGVIIGVMVTIIVGVIVVVNLVNSITPDDTWSTEANNTWSQLQANIWVAFALLVITPIIIGAVVILAIIRRGGMG